MTAWVPTPGTHRKPAPGRYSPPGGDHRELARMLVRAQEEERRNLARELHDDVTQRVAGAALELCLLLPKLDASGEGVKPAIEQVIDRLRRLSGDIHALARSMHPHTLEALGLARAIEGECREFAERTGLGVVTVIGPVDPRAPADVALVAFRVCQEALKNVEKHSRATSATVALSCAGDRLRLTVKDAGLGFVPQHRSAGIGLAGMIERAASVDGRLSIKSAPGRGTEVRLVVPIMRGDAREPTQDRDR